MKLKKGDRVYCKKDINYSFKEGLSYNILKVFNDTGDIIIYIGSTNNMYFNITYEKENAYKFSKYFYTEKQMRKLKLNEITTKVRTSD